jgi:putative oxidoreductase
MLVAIVTVHWVNGFWNTNRGYEYNLTVLASVTAVAIAGPGAYSLDQAFGIHLPEPLTLLAGLVALVLGVGAMLAFRSPKPAAQAKPQTT